MGFDNPASGRVRPILKEEIGRFFMGREEWRRGVAGSGQGDQGEYCNVIRVYSALGNYYCKPL